MFINSNKTFPTHKEFQMFAKGQLGNGLIKTINQKSDYFCIKEGCDYYVTIFSYNVGTISFYPSVFANDSVIAFKKTLSAIEEVE